jgi:hypothetical protein
VKKFSFDGRMNTKAASEWKKEAEMLKRIKFDRIVRLIAVSESPYCIVMQLMEGGIEERRIHAIYLSLCLSTFLFLSLYLCLFSFSLSFSPSQILTLCLSHPLTFSFGSRVFLILPVSSLSLYLFVCLCFLLMFNDSL